MPRTLNLKNPDAYRLARQVAAQTGESLTEAVVRALRERLARLRAAAPSPDLVAEMEAIANRICALPLLDTRSEDEILGYNERGLLEERQW